MCPSHIVNGNPHTCLTYKITIPSMKRLFLQRRVLETLIVSQLFNKFPSIYETNMFIAVSTTARHFSLWRSKLIQPTTSYSISLRFIVNSSFYLVSVLQVTSLIPCSTFKPAVYYIWAYVYISNASINYYLVNKSNLVYNLYLANLFLV